MDLNKSGSASCRCAPKKDVEPAWSHILDDIKKIAIGSKDEDFKRRCFAYFKVREWRDFTEALSAAMTTIAQRRFGKLSESLRGKEPTEKDNITVENGNWNSQSSMHLKDDERIYGEATLLQPKSSFTHGSLPSTYEHRSGSETATNNEDSASAFPNDIVWCSAEYGSASERHETTRSYHAPPIVCTNTTKHDIGRDDPVQTSSNSHQGKHGNQLTQDFGTQHSQCNSPCISEQDDWPIDFSWADTDHSSPIKYSPRKDCYIFVDEERLSVRPGGFGQSGWQCHSTGQTDTKKTVEPNEVNQCILLADDSAKFIENADDFESLAKLLC